MMPLRDESRRPKGFSTVTVTIIGINALVLLVEWTGGDAFVNQWSVVPADIVAGRHWITILTGMVSQRWRGRGRAVWGRGLSGAHRRDDLLSGGRASVRGSVPSRATPARGLM